MLVKGAPGLLELSYFIPGDKLLPKPKMNQLIHPVYKRYQGIVLQIQTNLDSSINK